MAIMMQKDITYREQFARAFGRNGLMHCLGLAMNWDDKILRIFPINTRGTGVCFVEVPIKDLNQFVDAVNECKESLEKIGVDCGGKE